MNANGIGQLRDAFAAGSAVVVAGTGVASALSGNAPHASWMGLLESGITQVEALTGDTKAATVTRSLLDMATPGGGADPLVMAATLVANGIKGAGEHAYARWLADTIGSLTVVDDALAQALSTLRAVTLTTNYDTLIEQALGRSSACWSDVSALRAAIANKESTAVGHLHGVWNIPDSVIFSSEDYSRLAMARAAQELQRAVTSLKTLVYVGFGSGLRDPNLGQLIRWSSGTFPAGSVQHYRLCRDDEVDQLRRENANADIQVVPYGKTYDELPDFLASLAPGESVMLSSAGLVRDVTAEAQRMLEQDLVDDSIIAESTAGEHTIQVVTVRPQLLQVPYPQYAKAIRSPKNAHSETLRPQPAEEAACESDLIVVVGPEESGLTTTIKLMALAAARCLGDVAPLYVNFRQCQRGPRPLQRQVALAARSAGLLTDRDVPSHPYVLALDDLNANVAKVSRTVIDALPPQGCVSVVIGCKEGFEDDVVEALKAMGLDPRVRYLRAMTREDVTTMAAALSPSAWQTLAEQAIQVIRTENLPNTPLSVGLLLSVLARGTHLAQSATQTAILDEYVSHLLGRGDPHEDARFGADQQTREALLSAFAEHLVIHESAGATETEAVGALADAIERFDWSESASDQLRSLLDRHVLRRAGDHIVFSRHSYLYLFAAKRAVANADFARYVRQRPLYYSAILRDQAALVRHDADLLRDVLPLIEGLHALPSAPMSAFDEFDRPDAYLPLDADLEAPAPTGTEVVPYDPGLLDSPVPIDEALPAFPSDDPNDMSYALRMARGVELVSAVLRDSDQIEDLELKRRALTECLKAWGHVVRAMESDPGFAVFSRDFAKALLDAGIVEADGEHHEELVDAFSRMLPTLFLFGGIAFALASRKLLAAFRHDLDAGDLTADETVEAGALVFAYVVKEPGWPKQARGLLAHNAKAWLVRQFMLAMWVDDFEHDRVDEPDSEDLLELCVQIRTDAQTFTSHADRVAFADRFRQNLRSRRVRARTRSADSRQSAGAAVARVEPTWSS